MNRRTHMTSLLALTAFGLLPATIALGQAGYPTRPIKMIVPFPPGGGADLTARLLAEKMSAGLGQPVVVDNKPGANGSIGTTAAAAAAPDGYTILMADRGALAINPSLYKSLAYDPMKSFAHVGIVTSGPYLLVVNPALGVNSVAELIALAKTKPLAYGSFGVGSMAQMNLEAFAHRTGIKLQHVPYKGAPPAVTAVVNGEVAIAIASPPSVLGFIAGGKLKALAVGAEKRIAQLSDVPTMAEAGQPDEVLVPTFFALSAPAGTPPAIVARLNSEMKRAVATPEVTARLAKSGLVPTAGTPEHMADTLQRDVARFRELANAVGIRAE